MEHKHVKIEYEEMLFGKKEILSTQINLINATNHIRNYKVLRKKELSEKTKLKSQLASLRSKVASLNSHLPENNQLPKKRTNFVKKENIKDFQHELDEIKEKLERLNNR